MISAILCSLLAAGCIGCAPDQYAQERAYWRVIRQAKRIFDNPQGSPPAQTNRVVMQLREFARAYPDHKLSLDAEFNIAHLYFARKEYARAREQLTLIAEKYAGRGETVSEALFLQGVSYQREGKIEAANGKFQELLAAYPDSKRAFALPFYFVRYYGIKELESEGTKALKDALDYYTNVAKNQPGTLRGFTADLFKARCYLERKKWESAAAEFDRVYEKYRGTKFNLEGVLFNLAFLYLKQLKNETKAKETLAILVRDYPKSSYISTARDLVRQMELQKKNK
jgi:TolA-binding protein